MTRSKLLRLLALVLVAVLTLSIVTTAFAYDTITYGEQSDAVRKMQKALRTKGYYKGTVDGKFGPGTKTAVRKYQASIGLYADGKPGNRTLTALYEGVSKLNKTSNTARKQLLDIKNPNSLYYGCSGSKVRALQKALKAVGYFKATVDGVYGDLTFAAVKKYQYAKGLHADGIAGSKTMASLNRNQNSVKLSNSMYLSVGSTGSEVKRVQQYLDALGHTNDDEAGYYGQTTAEAVKDWQRARGVSVTGSITNSDYNNFITKDD